MDNFCCAIAVHKHCPRSCGQLIWKNENRLFVFNSIISENSVIIDCLLSSMIVNYSIISIKSNSEFFFDNRQTRFVLSTRNVVKDKYNTTSFCSWITNFLTILTCLNGKNHHIMIDDMPPNKILGPQSLIRSKFCEIVKFDFCL